VSDRLLLDFDAFYLEHRFCDELDGDATDERAWTACSACDAPIEPPLQADRAIWCRHTSNSGI